eukprot:1323730-Prymnesium_polylepis.1
MAHTQSPPMRVRMLVVNEMTRLSGIKFVQIVKRSPRLGDSQYFLSEESHNMLDGLAREQRDDEARARDISATADP